MNRVIVALDEGEQRLIVEAATALRPSESEIAACWAGAYARTLGDRPSPTAGSETGKDFGLAVRLFLTSLDDGDFDGYFERIDREGENLARTREQYETLVLSFHLYEEATLPHLQRCFPERLGAALGALDQLYHNVIAILARAYFRQLERERELFTSLLAHDLRNPLMTVRSAASLLLSQSQQAAPSPANVALNAGRIQATADRMVRLIDSILSYGQLKSATASLEFSEFDLATAAREAAQLYLFETDRSRLQLRLDEQPAGGPAGASVLVRADRTLVLRAIGNLLTNAAKYARSTITVHVLAGPDAVLVRVRDDGPGIREDQLQRIFDDYYTAPGRKQGTGLGLPSVRMVAVRHGGRAWAESPPGEGATFHLSLPRRPPGSGAPDPA